MSDATTLPRVRVQAPTRPVVPNAPALAYEPNILAAAVAELERDGLVGEARLAKLLYLVFTSRLMDRPLCNVIKGPSSAGKSTTIGKVMKLFPENAYHYLTSMSNRAIVYNDTVSLVHRILVVAEAAGLVKDGNGAMMLRSLLSEGRLCYETVENINGVMSPRRIEREGPTGLVTTTTKGSIEEELATRMFAAPIDDSPAQTQRVMRSISERWAGDNSAPPFDPAPWIEYQEWLADANHSVVIPYIRHIDEAIPPDDTRLRRDFGALATMIAAHAMLHQVTRGRDRNDNVIATVDDYAVVRDVVADIVAEGVGASVPKRVRETVGAVRALGNNGVTATQIADRLRCHKTTVVPYVETALQHGWLFDAQATRGAPHALVIGDPLPAEREVLPTADAVRQAMTTEP